MGVSLYEHVSHFWYVHSENRREANHVDMALCQCLPRMMLVLFPHSRGPCTYLSSVSGASDESEAMDAISASTVTTVLDLSVLDFSVGPRRRQLERSMVSKMVNDNHGQDASLD